MPSIKHSTPRFVFLSCILMTCACGDDTLPAYTSAKTSKTHDAGDVISPANQPDDIGGETGETNDACTKALGVSCPDMEQTYIKSSNTTQHNKFGSSVSLHKDTLVVGTPGEASSGAVYVFVRSGSVWKQQAHLQPSNTEEVSWFGSSVSLHKDTLVVSALETYGAVFVFVRKGSDWTQQAHLKGANPETDNAFGSSVSLYEDTLVVSDNSPEGYSTQAHSVEENKAVYVFTRKNATWTQQAYITPPTAKPGEIFGRSVSLHKDTLVIGTAGSFNAGSVYVYVRSDSDWTQQAYIKPSHISSVERFGHSVFLHEDTLVVGSPGGFFRGGNGAVYVYVRSGGSDWTQQAHLKADNSKPGHWFGSSVSLHKDTLVVGTPLEDSKATGINTNRAQGDAGSAYVFTRKDTMWTQQNYIKASNPDKDDRFGDIVSLYEHTLVIAAPFEDSNARKINGNQLNNDATNSGAVYVRDLAL